MFVWVDVYRGGLTELWVCQHMWNLCEQLSEWKCIKLVEAYFMDLDVLHIVLLNFVV